MPTMTAAKGASAMERKIVRISSKRQLTIPQKFFTALNFGSEAECMIRGGELVIHPARERSDGAFAEQILAELVGQGLSGDALLAEFRRRQAQVRPAVEALIAEAEDAARGSGEYASYEDVFGTEEAP